MARRGAGKVTGRLRLPFQQTQHLSSQFTRSGWEPVAGHNLQRNNQLLIAALPLISTQTVLPLLFHLVRFPVFFTAALILSTDVFDTEMLALAEALCCLGTRRRI